MIALTGAAVRRALEVTTDVVVVGSGPAGAAAAATLAERGVDVIVVEAGRLFEPSEFAPDSLGAMTSSYVAAGAQVTASMPAIPFVQARAVGGTSVVNGAISWRLPRDVWQEWVDADPALAESLSWERVSAAHDAVEARLGIAPTDDTLAGRNNDLMAAGAEALGLEHRPIRRNTRGCEGSGRCLQGCPKGRKQSMDRTYLWDAVEHGARVFAQMRVVRVDQRRGRAIGVSAVTPRGARVRLRARHGVVLAASATATPCLLWKSGIRSGPVGQNLMAHPGVAAAGRFAEPVDLWTGATQGHEVIGLRSEGLKFEALGYDRAMAATRVDGVGHRLAAGLGGLRQWAHWGVAVRARARGTVRPGLFGAPRIVYRLPEDDLRKMRRGLAVLGRMLHAAGAEEVDPHVFGWSRAVADAAEWDAFEQSAPLDPAAYTPVVTHIFGTCRMGSDPATSVVGPDFAHHEVAGLWVVDSSVFPSNTGVNPQTSIIALATLAANMA